MGNNIYKDITKVFSPDAEFGFRNGMKHYEDRIRYGEIPKTMTYQQYFSKSKEVSLKRIDGKNVRAYRYKGDRIIAEARNGSCLGCNMNLPPQVFNSLYKVDNLVVCPHCQRMLFLRPQAEEAAN